ncbi:Nin one binding Zn-ribbon like-domain-containing protein [Phlyctochytrium arcticum]|nr:Nin one binding Zn-ribbon like-domain-containing protein [Phlyctochytrium arcticum]
MATISNTDQPVADSAPVVKDETDTSKSSVPTTGNRNSQGKVQVLVLDAAPLIKGQAVAHLAERFVTIPEVLHEIRDRQARKGLAVLPFELETKVPSDESMAAVVAFSKRTGDFSVLSATDLKVLALTWMMEKEVKGTVEHLRTEPVAPQVAKGKVAKAAKTKDEKKAAESESSNQAPAAVESESVAVDATPQADQSQDVEMNASTLEKDLSDSTPAAPEENLELSSDEDDEEGPTEEEIQAAQQRLAELSLQHGESDEQDDDNESDDHEASDWENEPPSAPSPPSGSSPAAEEEEDEGEWQTATRNNKKSRAALADLGDDEGWITPNNIKRVKGRHSGNRRTKPKKTAQALPVACITADFAMQNVLIQMGLRLVSLDGMAITQLRNYVLRCHACYKVTKDMDKKFCPSCGNNTLIRTSVGVDAEGNTTYFLKKNFQYITRGSKFPIPTPKGGRNNNDILLREDQREYQRAYKYAQRKKEAIDPFDADFVPLENVSGNSRKGAMPVIGVGRRNVNVAKKTHQKRR